MGFIVRLVTNAWWAFTYRSAYEFLSQLYSIGLKELNISYDDFHSRYIPAYKVKNAIEAAVDLGLSTCIAIIKHKYSIISEETVLKYLEITDMDIIRKVKIITDYFQPLGRGKYLSCSLPTNKNNKYRIPCNEILKSIGVLPNGDVLACCGHIISEKIRRYLTLGNIHNDDLISMFRRARRNILYWWLFYKGPYHILRTLNASIPCFSTCHCCYILLSKYIDRLISFLNRNKYKVFLKDVLLCDLNEYINRYLNIISSDKVSD